MMVAENTAESCRQIPPWYESNGPEGLRRVREFLRGIAAADWRREAMKRFQIIIVLSFAISTPLSLFAAEDLLMTFKALKPEVALDVAQATMTACREAGYQVSVAVVDRSGVTQVMLRDQVAGAHTLDAARRKAWTAASYNADTRSISEATRPGGGQSGARFVAQAIMVGGGVPLYAEGTLVGSVGVSGSPSADEDQKCAEKGAEALEEKMLF
jgi:uncharacterized protein GlcG (DUF336 family)